MFSEGLAGPCAGVLKEQMGIGPIHGAPKDMAEWDNMRVALELWATTALSPCLCLYPNLAHGQQQQVMGQLPGDNVRGKQG